MRRLHKILMMLTAIVSLTPAVALAQGEPTTTAHVTGARSGNGRGFGIGAEGLFTTASPVPPNLLLTYGDNGGRFHIDGLFGLHHTNATNFDLGVNGWYHIHAASAADFSVGAGLAIIRRRIGAQSAQWDFLLDLGAQVRAFIVPNVALLGAVGMGIYIPDTGDTVIDVAGTLVGSVGVAYYFL